MVTCCHFPSQHIEAPSIDPWSTLQSRLTRMNAEEPEGPGLRFIRVHPC